MSDAPVKMTSQFYDTVKKLMVLAESFESELSVEQIHSAFLYASSCYSAKNYSAICAKRGVSIATEINETVEIYREMLENGIEHYESNKDS